MLKTSEQETLVEHSDKNENCCKKIIDLAYIILVFFVSRFVIPAAMSLKIRPYHVFALAGAFQKKCGQTENRAVFLRARSPLIGSSHPQCVHLLRA